MLNISNLRDYQKKAIAFQCRNPLSMLWVDPGLGKTAITLTTINHLISIGHLKGCLVVAPKKVVQLVWRQESKKWSHLEKVTFSVIAGTKDQRTRALLKKANIYLTNYENIKWLSETLITYFVKKGKDLPFDGIVYDEISKMKNSQTNRVTYFKKITPLFKFRTGLTGTPSSNGVSDLHGQYLMIDEGARLGRTKTIFRERFFNKRGMYNYELKDTSEDRIKELISDITLEMSGEDYLQLPDLVVNDILLELTPELANTYALLEEDFFLTLDSGVEIEVFNQVSLMNKCLQFSNGAIYPVAGLPMWEPIHDIKLDALEDIIDEHQGHPILVAYQFKSDATRIMERFKHLSPVNLTDLKTDKQNNHAISEWKKGNIRLMIGHPASMGHGVDGLQDSGNVLVWYGLNWSLELYEQFNSRLRRQGQGRPVICHRLIVNNTLDISQRDRLLDKDKSQKAVRSSLKEYRKMKGF